VLGVLAGMNIQAVQPLPAVWPVFVDRCMRVAHKVAIKVGFMVYLET
jgi:hypothetical protein